VRADVRSERKAVDLRENPSETLTASRLLQQRVQIGWQEHPPSHLRSSNFDDASACRRFGETAFACEHVRGCQGEAN
jgi:hypothetical protein